MEVNQNKLARQLLMIERWWSIGKASAIACASTGFGKTYVILLIIKRMIAKYPNYRTTVIVPSAKLKEDWERQILEMNLTNVTVYVVNTYIKLSKGSSELETDLLAADEVHHYCSPDAFFFNKVLPITQYKYFIGVSATLEPEEIAFLASCNVKLFDNVTIEEAEKNGWVAPSIVYNLELPFTEEDKKQSASLDNLFKVNFARFNHSFDLMMACSGGNKKFKIKLNSQIYWKTGKEWREWWASEMGWNGDEDHNWSPTRIITYALRGTRAMKERKSFLYNIPSKINVVLQLLDKFKDKKIIIFCESREAADKLEELRPNEIKSYHSGLETIIVDGKKLGVAKRRKKIIEDFENADNSCRAIACVKALDEGFNVESIEIGIQHSYSSVARRDIQRSGRAGRIDYDNLGKICLNINLYMQESQELKWLKSKQKGRKSIKWVKKLDEIVFEGQIASLI